MESVTTTTIRVRETPPFFDTEEMDILYGITEGKTAKEIAEETGKNRRTLEQKVVMMRKKVCARSSAQLVAEAYHLGILIPLVKRRSDGGA